MSAEPEPSVPGTAEEGELRLGQSERGTAANGVILALTRAARSFLLYDPANEAIRHFLGALRTAVEDYLAAHGDLPLEVRPFELVVHGEIVYLDRDRERSLAFRLYRDGIRKITLQVGLDWHELLKVLEVLSIRYTGVRQAEDDMVVLLWKAGFAHIQLEAVEGFVPEDEVGDVGVAAAPTRSSVEFPSDFDLPPPALPPATSIAYRPLADWALAPLIEEDGTPALPGLCVRLLHELGRAASDPTETLTFAELVPLFREVRDFLLSEGLLSSVLDVVRALAALKLRSDADTAERDALLSTFGDERAIGRLLHSVPRDATSAPPDMIELLDMLPGNHLRMILAVLATEQGEAARRVARSLIERYVARNVDWIAAELGTAEPNVAVDLLRAFVAAEPQKALDHLGAVAGRPELELQLEVLHVLDAAPSTAPAVPKLLLTFLAAPSEEVRVRALEAIAKKNLRTAFGAIADRLKREALRLPKREAEAAGSAMARTDPAKALELFREWMKPRGFFSGILPGQSTLQWAGVSGCVFLPGDEPEALVKMVADRAGTDLQQHCTASMVRRRRLARGLQ